MMDWSLVHLGKKDVTDKHGKHGKLDARFLLVEFVLVRVLRLPF